MYTNGSEELNRCVVQFEKIHELLETEYAELQKCLKGDILEAYKELLACEKNVLQDTKQKLMNYKSDCF